MAPERVEHCYDVVVSHLCSLGTWRETIRRFPAPAVKAAVKQVLERLASDAQARPLVFDWAAEFEQLRDFETVDDFLAYLESEHKLPSNWEAEARELALEKLEEDALLLDRIILSPAEYYYLKRMERSLKKLKRAYNID